MRFRLPNPPRLPSRLRPALSVASICLALAGCGGSQEPEPPEQPQTTAKPQTLLERDVIETGLKADARLGYRARLDEICLAADRALDRAAKQELPSGEGDEPEPTRAELQRFYDEVVVPTRQGQLEAMQRVERPGSGSSTDLDAVDVYLGEFLEATRALGADLALIKEPGIEETAFDQAERLAADAGLRRCSGDSSEEE